MPALSLFHPAGITYSAHTKVHRANLNTHCMFMYRTDGVCMGTVWRLITLLLYRYRQCESNVVYEYWVRNQRYDTFRNIFFLLISAKCSRYEYLLFTKKKTCKNPRNAIARQACCSHLLFCQLSVWRTIGYILDAILTASIYFMVELLANKLHLTIETALLWRHCRNRLIFIRAPCVE